MAFVDVVVTPQAGFEAALLDSEAESLFHRFESVVPDPFLSAFRNEGFFSEAATCGLSFAFLVGGDFLTATFLGGGFSEPLMDDAELIGFRDRF